MPVTRNSREWTTNALNYASSDCMSSSRVRSPGFPASYLGAQPQSGTHCFSSTQTAKKVPRPPNAFIIFRSDYRASHPCEKSMPVVSKKAAAAWRALPEAERLQYESRAVILKAQHSLMHPDYQYNPKRKPKTSQKELRHNLMEKICTELTNGRVADALTLVEQLRDENAPPSEPSVLGRHPILPTDIMINPTNLQQHDCTLGWSTLPDFPWVPSVEDTIFDTGEHGGISNYQPAPCYPENYESISQYYPAYNLGESLGDDGTWANWVNDTCSY